MKKSEIIQKIAEITDLLYNAQAGHGTSEQRTENRRKAGEIMAGLPKGWWKKVDEKTIDLITTLS